MTEKQYMLALINAERKKAGVSPVELGDNIAAQLHAESSLANCFSSH
ncbi:MAG: CAP domain-containing protein [Chloroflexi bacterium]|nr:CAP domain-containing protein [Chloroflexota bacterium]